MKIRTKVKSGAISANHNAKAKKVVVTRARGGLTVRTDVKAGAKKGG